MTLTYCTCLTPPATGAIATLAVRGPSAWRVVRELSQRPLPELPQPERFWLTRLGDAARGEADDVVVALKSITPEPSVELHCHGGREVIRLLEELLAARGIGVVDRISNPSGEIGTDWKSVLQAAALDVLTRAPTVRTAAIALDQFHGAFSRAIEAIHAALQRNDLTSADRLLAELELWSALGSHLATPWRVVIAGAPNVGKSSLVNAVAGYQRSVVSPIPGTTRDVVTTLLALDGWPVEIADTAGWRRSDSPLEREGIDRARRAIAAADLCLWMLDSSTPPVWPEANLGPVHFVINKIDLASAWPQGTVDAIRISAQTGAGIAELCTAIAQGIVPQIPPPGAAVPFNPGLAATVAEARALAKAGRAPEAIEKLENLGRECN